MAGAQSDFTPNLSLPFLLPSQAQKHVTVNETLAAIDAFVMGAVEAAGVNDPPTEPQNGEAHILSGAPSGAWSGHSDELAVWADGAWAFYPPQSGWRIWDKTSQRLLVFNEGAWTELEVSAPERAPLFGVNTDADTVNRFAVKSGAILFSHDDVTPGSGDMRLSFNKAGAGDTASLIFQSGWSGRAELGLTGDEDLSLRVSSDGSSWQTALQFDAATGHAGLGAAPNSTDQLHISGQVAISGTNGSVVQKPSGRIELYRNDSDPVYLRSMSDGTRLHMSVRDSSGTNHNDALVLIPDSERLRTTFTIGPWSDADIDLGFAQEPFRDLYLTNAPVISSDVRGKTDIETFDAGLELLQGLNPVTFRRKGTSQRRHIGLIAQQVRSTLEEIGFAESGIWSLADPHDADSHQAVAYSELVPVLIDAVNELAERLEDLEARALRT